MFQPVLPAGGLLGWRFLERTMDSQLEAFGKSTTNQNQLTYFRENIGKISTAEELVADRRLLSVALGAFQLSDDINSKFFIRRVLEEGTDDPGALANRLADTRYRDLASAFGFGDAGGPFSRLSGFPDRIEARFNANSFEVAVGEQSESLRIALYAKRTLPELAENASTDRTAWFSIMGSEPLRELVEGALSLPRAVGTLDLDRQLDEFRRRSQQTFGVSSVAELASPENLERMVERYLLLRGNDTATVTSPALQILRGF